MSAVKLTLPPGVTFGSKLKAGLAGAPPPPMSMQDAAAAIAASMIDPQTAAINRAVQLKQGALAQEGPSYGAVIDALGRLTAPIPAAIQGAYAGAGDRVAGYASGLTGALGDAAKSAAATAAAHIASLGAPGTVTSTAPDAMNVANYEFGALPSSSLASEAASRLSEAEGQRAASGYALGQQALAQMNATRQEIADLQAKGLDIENTRPAEVQKALASLRDQNNANAQLAIQEQNFKLQARAEGVQESQLNRAWLQTLNSEAYNRTNATGTLWVVQGNKIINTGQSAPGSAAGRAASTAVQRAADRRAGLTKAQLAADVSRERISEQQAHNRVIEGIDNSRIGISQQQADTAVKREQAYERYLAGKTKGKAGLGGMKESDVRQYGSDAGKYAYTFFFGAKNPKFDPSKGGGPGKPPVPGNPYYSTPPGSASDAMSYMLSKKIPYSIAWNAIYQYANRQGSHWADALDWNPKYKPPARRGK